jgi:hypothetical protein
MENDQKELEAPAAPQVRPATPGINMGGNVLA